MRIKERPGDLVKEQTLVTGFTKKEGKEQSKITPFPSLSQKIKT